MERMAVNVFGVTAKYNCSVFFHQFAQFLEFVLGVYLLFFFYLGWIELGFVNLPTSLIVKRNHHNYPLCVSLLNAASTFYFPHLLNTLATVPFMEH